MGRACLGRPWLLGQVASALRGEKPRLDPPLSEAVCSARDHLHRLVHYWGDEGTAVRQGLPSAEHGP